MYRKTLFHALLLHGISGIKDIVVFHRYLTINLNNFQVLEENVESETAMLEMFENLLCDDSNGLQQLSALVQLLVTWPPFKQQRYCALLILSLDLQ